MDQSKGNELRAKGVLKGITFSYDAVGLTRQMEVPDRSGKIRTQEDTLQFSKITDIAEEAKRNKRRGTVTFFGSLIGVIGVFFGIVAVSVTTNLVSVSIIGAYGDAGIGLILIILSIVVISRYRRIDRYFQVVSPQIPSEDFQEWQIVGDKHGTTLRSIIRSKLKS